MASTAYRVRFRLLLADDVERRNLYDHLIVVLSHLEPLRVRLESIVVDPTTRNVTVTVNNPIRQDQLEHLGLVPV